MFGWRTLRTGTSDVGGEASVTELTHSAALRICGSAGSGGILVGAQLRPQSLPLSCLELL